MLRRDTRALATFGRPLAERASAWSAWALAGALLAASTFGCAGTDDGAAADAGSVGVEDAAGDVDGDGDGAAGDPAETVDAGSDATAEQPPAPFDYTGKTCPTFVAGANKLQSFAEARTFDLYLPPEPKGAALLYLWHGLGDTKENFGKAFGAQALAKALGAIVVVPQAKGKATGWGWGKASESDSDAALFDDLLACVDGQYDIDNARVASMGFSSGGLWTTWLVLNRARFLASAVIWSGGTSGSFNVYKTPKRKLPVIVAWGGPQDEALLKFEPMSIALADGLEGDGHFILRCNHKLGHTIPSDGLKLARAFLQDHTWHDAGASPWQQDPASLAAIPSYCEVPSGP